MRAALRFALALAIAGPALPLAQAPQAADIAARVQQRYASVRAFSADFTHTYQGGVLRQKTTERGTVVIKKPGRMRWTYTAPEKKEFVSDGRQLYSYLAAEKQVYVSDIPAGSDDTSAALFLAGRGDVTRDFTAALTGQDDATYTLKLTPKARQQEFDTLTLVVDRQSMQIRSLIATDRQGGTSTFVFANLRENVSVPDSTFTFKTPRGVKVVRSNE